MVLGWLLESSVTLTTINTITHVSNQIVCNRLITDQVFNWHASLQFVPHIRSVFLPGQCPCWLACCKQITAWMSKRQLRLKEAFVHKGRGMYRENERRPFCSTYRVESHLTAWRSGWKGLSSWASSVSLSIRLTRSWADTSRFLMCWTAPVASPSSCMPFALCVWGVHVYIVRLSDQQELS